MHCDWHDHEAQTRGRVRLDNERTASGFEHTADGVCMPLTCECGNEPCESRTWLTFAEYESIRLHPRRFLIALDHENPQVEAIVSQTKRFAVVETLAGGASRIAEETDPRAEPMMVGSMKEAQ
jgi:hypothetical protein